MRRSTKITAGVLLGVLLVAVLGVGGVMIAGNTGPGRAWIERLTYQLTGGYVRLSGLGGQFPSQITLRELQLVDRNGTWLVADDVRATWSPLRLVERRIEVFDLRAGRLHMERAPVGDGKGGKASIPDIEVAQFSSPTVELGAPLAGSLTTFSLDGGIRLRSLENAKVDVIAHRLRGAGDYTLHVRFDSQRVDGSLALHEPANGPLENILSLPGLGALTATASMQGSRDAEVVHLDLTAGGLQAQVQGGLDLTHTAANLDYFLSAPAMAPRSDLAWDSIALRGNWHGELAAASAQAKLEIERLRIAGTTRVANLSAQLDASQGKFGLHATVGGLEIPGAQPRLFAADPVTVEASLRWDPVSRPLEVDVKHPSLALQARTDFARQKPGQTDVGFELRLPDLADFAALTGEDMRGGVLLKGHWTHEESGELLALDGNATLTGGTANWIPMVAPQVALQLAGSVTQNHFAIDNVRIAGRTLTFAASGGADRVVAATVPATPVAPVAPVAPEAAQGIKNLQLRWQLSVPDLAPLATDLRGQLKATGHVSGSLAALSVDAQIASQLSVRDSPSGEVTASVRVRGLPLNPSGTVQAHGMLDGAPLDLDASVERSGANQLRVAVRQADWKSAHVDGDLSADIGLTTSHGKLAMRIAQLSDLDRLLGVQLSGSLQGDAAFIPLQGETQGQMHLDGKDLVIGSFAGNVHLEAAGVPSGLALRLTADAPNLYGAPASLESSAELDLKAAELRLAGLSLGYRGETLKTLAPAILRFGKGMAVDDLRFGVRDAVLDIKGQLTPTLELRGSLTQLKPELVNVFAPELLASGELEARAHLQGSLANPTGSIRVLARDIRFAADDAVGLPPVALRARADLAEGLAALDATLTAGSASKLTASGSVPLQSAGALNVKIGGTLDVGLANPFMEARGLHATGQLTTDAALSGSLDAPQIGGEITLARGSLRDYGHGVNLADISAQVVGDQSGVKIQNFRAKAASGTVSMTGTLGLLQPGLPLDLQIDAKNAQPIASSIVTANLDADVHVSGTAREHLDVTGKIHVIRANIGIPNSLPPDVAVLDVRRRGQAAVADSAKQLVVGMDISVEAPQQILVQGRGLDAEMGGEIHLTGTTDAPLAAGGLDLQRGSFTLAGNKLTFTQGRVSFDGAGLKKKIDPTLDFTAQTSLSSTTATLRITGLADAPRFEFSSSPVLPQDEIMAQLLFGENAAQLTALQAAEIGAALATLTGVGGSGSNPLVKLQKSLGLDRLSVGSNTTTSATGTESSGAAIEAGRYISKRVYVEGKQSTQGTSQVQVDVDLTKHLKLQTRLGNGTATTQGTTPENDPGSSIGLSYQFEY